MKHACWVVGLEEPVVGRTNCGYWFLSRAEELRQTLFVKKVARTREKLEHSMV